MSDRKNSAFTLIELLIVIAIVIVMSAVAIPSFRHVIASDRLESVADQLASDMKLVKEDAILYQQNLVFYINYNNTPVDNLDATNANNRSYCYETFYHDVTVPDHFIPTDAPDNKHFFSHVFDYGIVIDSVSPSYYHPVTFNGKNYVGFVFYSGTGDTFRGQCDLVTGIADRKITSTTSVVSPPIVITLKDPSTGLKYYVRVSSTGKISVYGQPRPY
jgi:prepilin-type N-terminal cleavage/methylation domain-containing protein